MTQEDGAYACCSIGIGRWFWAVWANKEDARESSRPLACGYEKTGEAAERKALEAAGSQSERLPAKWASRYKRGGGARPEDAANKPKSRLSRRPATPATANVPARPTFLYLASESEEAGSRGEVVIVRHRIVRKTAKKIFIDREPFHEKEQPGGEGAGPMSASPKPRTIAVDRETLRREGRVPHRGAHFHATEDDAVRDVHAARTARHAWCATLGVRFPCTAESIKVVYRRLALEKHPDAGGSPAEFLALQRAYREALAYFSSTDDDAAKPGQV
jgi:hypothetical protein